MTITFQVDNVSPLIERALPYTSATSVSDKKLEAEAEAGSGGAVIDFEWAPTSNSFLDAVHTAWDSHLPLTLRPDDFWLCIAQGFGIHVNENAEELRDRFVEHEGQKEIHIRRDHFVRGSSSNDWEGCFAEFSEKIGKEIGEHNQRLIVPDFSTTTAVDRAAGDIVLMDAMSAYFTYGLSTACGFPEITLEGTAEDWHSIYTRVQALSEFNLQWWTDHLLPVMEKVISTVDGNPDIEFWRSFYKSGGGSGGPFVNGWVNTLFPYMDLQEFTQNNMLDRWQEIRAFGGYNPDQFPNGLGAATVVWDYYGTEFEYRFAGGFLGVKQDRETLGVRPNIGWTIGEKSNHDS